MCGIAGIIHKGKSTNVGGEMQKMLQSLNTEGLTQLAMLCMAMVSPTTIF